MPPIATMPGFFFVGLAFTTPTIVVLLWLALRFATTTGQRLTNLISGCVFAVGAVIVLATFFNPQPESWADQYS